ncbi:MAG: hypothetical protein ABI699_01150 [Caldimonas sp.]
MEPREPASAPADRDGLRFNLCVYPQEAERPWRAELLDEAGRQCAFATPLELIRHLVQLGSPPAGLGGLR